jgi:polysaccharide chain length determinant protein (PEP-CTERM system associated)
MLDRLSIPRRPLDFEDYLDILRRSLRWIIAPAFIGLVAATLVAFSMNDTFVSTALIRIVPQQVPESLVQNAVNQQLGDRIDAMAQTIESRTTLTNIINSYGLYKAELKREPLDDVISKMQKAIHINASGSVTNSGRNLPAFQLSFSYDDRHVAQKVCQELVSRFVNENTRGRYDDAVATHQFMNDEFEKAKRELDALEQKLTEFRMRNAGHLPEQMEANVQQLNALESRLSGLNQAQSRVSQEKMMLESSLSIAKDRLASIRETSPEIQARSEKIDQYDRQITALEANIAAMKEKYTDSYPDLEAARAQLSQLRRQREEALKTEKVKPAETHSASSAMANRERMDGTAEIERLQAALRAKELEAQEYAKETASATAAVRGYQGRIEGIPMGEREYQELLRDRDLAKAKYQDLQVKLSKSAISQEMENRKQGENLEVLDQASLPESPTEPRRGLIIPAGLAAGLGLGIIIVVIREVKDTSLKNLKDARLYTQLSILGSIPLLENDLVVQRRKQMMWVGWATATLVGVAAMGLSMAHYYFNKV